MKNPPRIAKAVLGRCVPAGLYRDSALGDLEEGFYGRVRSRGAGYAATWYWIQAGRLGVRYLLERLVNRGIYTRQPGRRSSMKNLFESTILDLRVGARALFKQPSSTAISILAFGLGIGLCTTMFSIAYGTYMRGLDVPESDRLVVVNRNNPSQNISRMSVTLHDLYDWREQQRSFEGLAGFSTGTMHLSDAEVVERYVGAFVTANVFDVLRVRPILGNTFRDGDDRAGAPLTVVIAFDVWTSQYGSDPDIIGATVKVNGEQGTIIGVMPEGFLFPVEHRIWIPQRDERAETQRGDGPFLRVFGRLDDGVSWDEAQLDMSLIASRLAEAYPESNEGVGIVFNTIIEISINDAVLPIVVVMQVATVFVLLIACANVSNLLLARATLRKKEAAVRTAVGASRFRVTLPFFAEASFLSLAGAALGVGIAYVSIEMVNQATVDVGKPYFMVLAIDLPVLGFVIAITMLTALVSAAAPAFQTSRADVNAILKDEGRGSQSFRASNLSKLYVVGEIAMSCALLVAAGLMTKSIVNLRSQEFEFTTEGVFTARVGVFGRDFPTREERYGFFRDVHERLTSIPGARAVAMTNVLPTMGAPNSRFGIEGEVYASDSEYPRVHAAVATPGLFSAFGTSVIEGRDFSADDGADAPSVVLVNERFVERFFPGEDPIGRRIRQGRSDSEADWSTIIGIVPDLGMESLGGINASTDDPAGYYVPLAQMDRYFMSIVIQVAGGSPLAITPEVRAAVRAVHPDTPIFWIRDMPEVIRQGTWFYSLFGGLFIAFGLAALFLASVGLYGVISFSVNRRLQEMGIRMALGAKGVDVIRLVLRDGALQLLVGLALGLGLALATSSIVATIIFEVQPRDPTVFLSIVGVIIAVGLFASYVPACRATRVDPMDALRYE